MNIRFVIITVDMFRLKMRRVTAVEVAKATRSPNRVNIELCHYLLNLKESQRRQNHYRISLNPISLTLYHEARIQ